MKRKKTTNAIAIIHRRYYEGRPERLAALEQERINAKVARELYTLRTRRKKTQKEVASLVGTTPSVISRLEKSDYVGHSLNMIQRVAASLDYRIDIKFTKTGRKRRVLTHR
jgi:DNA-binding XRE family transcriptional regulator